VLALAEAGQLPLNKFEFLLKLRVVFPSGIDLPRAKAVS
jgi:hypothetical protein